jgi:hypothetical protein
MRGLGISISEHKLENFGYIIICLIVLQLFDNPISKYGVRMCPNHASSGTLSKWPLGHVTTFSIDENDAHGDVIKSWEILEKKPGQLSAVDIPY